MAEYHTPTLPSGPIGLDFATLKAEGIVALQNLCGGVWTDYNLHDPGVTVLEQLVYGLTDLAYRTEFSVADYLTGPDGVIDYAALALHPPRQAFHGQALTANDYRRVLYDAIPSITEVWVRALGNGRLAIDVAVRDEIQSPQGRADIEQRVRQHYAAQRALGEDLATVTALAPQRYFLDGEIVMDGERPGAEVLAQILFDCRSLIAAGPKVERLRDLVERGMAPEQIYEGPPTAHGHIAVDEAPEQARAITVGELVGVIQQIQGVSQVRRLVLRDERGDVCESIACNTATGRYPCLPFPSEAQYGFLRLRAGQGTVPGGYAAPDAASTAPYAQRAFYTDATQALKKLQFQRQAFRDNPGVHRAAFPVPVGRYRPLAAYDSVQNDFPAVYGIGRYGVPRSDGPERIAQARQLKGFLFPFEQLMANYLQNLQELPRLFSTGDDGRASYFHQPLSERQIPGIAALLIDGDSADAPRRALEDQDDYAERKGRIYDYLLALHGDAFPQTTLRRFNHYRRDDTERWLLDAKAQLVRNLVELSAWRGRAGNYLAEAGAADAVSMLERRVAILIGLGNGPAAQRAGTVWGGAARHRVGAHARVRGPGWLGIPPGQAGSVPDAADFRLALPADAFTARMFRAGAVLDNYALAADDAGPGVTLYCGAGEAWDAVGHYASGASAERAARACAALLAEANQAYEQPCVVEHVLLWPSTRVPLDKDFFGARISIVLAEWTVRGADPDYRAFVRDTVLDHCPAHVHPAFLWLPQDAMARFDGLWRAWRGALHDLHKKRRTGEVRRSFDHAAGAMADFLRAAAARYPEAGR